MTWCEVVNENCVRVNTDNKPINNSVWVKEGFWGNNTTMEKRMSWDVLLWISLLLNFLFYIDLFYDFRQACHIQSSKSAFFTRTKSNWSHQLSLVIVLLHNYVQVAGWRKNTGMSGKPPLSHSGKSSLMVMHSTPFFI